MDDEARTLMIGASGWALAIGIVLGLCLGKEPKDKPKKSEGKE